jgi:hypothetical protein
VTKTNSISPDTQNGKMALLCKTFSKAGVRPTRAQVRDY